MKPIVLCLMLVMALSTFAKTASVDLLAQGQLLEGSYLGEQKGDDEVHLLIKKAMGCPSCFLGILIKKEKKLSLYKIEPTSKVSNMVMTPLEIIGNGRVGMVNDDPSLVMNLMVNDKGKNVIRLVDAHSSNNKGFAPYIEFKGDESPYTWSTALSGNFDYYASSGKSAKGKASISSIDTTEREAAATLMTKDFSGSYVLKERWPLMYTFNAQSHRATGEQTQKDPQFIVVFIKKGRYTYMHLVNPKNDEDINIFRLK